MKLLIISDLHFDKENDWDFINIITKGMISKVKRRTKDYEELIVIVLGDIIHRGGDGNLSEKFSEAEKFIDRLKKEFSNIKFLFIPGNHEIVVKGEEPTRFNEFCKKHSYKKEILFTKECSVYAFEEAGINIILADSTLNRYHAADGKIDVQAIKDNLKMKNLIFMHHPPCKIEGVDRSVVNTKELIATRANFIFYGHQHGGAVITDFLEGDTDIHTVGTLLRQENGALHEFLLLDILDGKFRSAYRYTYTGYLFALNVLFPTKNDFKSHKLPFASPTNEIKTKISRKFKCISDSNSSSENDGSIWTKYIGENIESIIKKYNKILFVGDAGIGKSFELAGIYESFKNDEDYYPLWLIVRNTNYDDIKKHIVYAQNCTIDKKLPCLIIDGFDEMDSDKVSTFIKDIGSATNGNSDIKIIISVRTNYKNRLDGFIEYGILPLDTNQIRDIATESGVTDEIAFINCLESSGCLPLAQIPFYLVDMIQLYLKNGALPKRDELLDRIITFRFIKGDEKYPVETKKKLMSNEYELRKWLKELSFFMQSQQLYSIDNIRYTQYFSPDKREFFDRTGLISCNGSEHTLNCEFNHNIFREYFAASYIYNLPMEELLELITLDSSHKKLRPSWVNIVSFVLALRKADDLKDWLIENAKDVLIQFETDRLSEDDRNNIFISIMEDSFRKEIPVYSSYDVPKLTQHFQSIKSIDYMIKILQKPCSERAVLSSLRILKYCTLFFNKEMELKEVIFKYINQETSEYVVSYAVSALTNIFSSELLDLLEDIFSLVEKDNRPEVVDAICELIVKTNTADIYIDYILDKLNQIEGYGYSGFNVLRKVEKVISALSQIGTIIKSLNWLSSDKNYYKYDEMFERLILNALQFNNVDELLGDFVDIFIVVSGKRDSRKIKIVKSFFMETKTLSGAFKLLLTSKKLSYELKLYAIEDIMDETLTEILVESYVKDEIEPEVYKEYAKRLPENSRVFADLNSAVINKEGCKIQREEKKDWEKILRQSKQIYFNSLFSKMSFSVWIQELVSFMGEDIKCSELFDDRFERVPNNRNELISVLGDVYNWNTENCLVSKFMDSIDWDVFSISKICEVLRNREQVNITSEQEKFIREYYNDKIETIDFEILEQNNPEHELLFMQAKQVFFLMKMFNFPCRDEKLLEMVMLPWYIFEPSTGNSESETLKFIMQRISDTNKLQEKIINNLKTKELSPLAAHTHIVYCLEKNLPHAAKISENLFKSKDTNAVWCRNTAVDYLIATKGYKYVDELIGRLDSPDTDLLNHLAYRMKSNNECLIAKLIEGNENSTDYKLYLENLIRLNTRYGLEKYIEIVKKENILPDISESTCITEAIGEICNIELIDCISALLVICYSENFIDKKDFGLKWSLGNAINKLIQHDAKKVKETLLYLIEQYGDNKDLIQKSYWHLREADMILDKSNDLPWKVEKTIEFIKQHQPRQTW